MYLELGVRIAMYARRLKCKSQRWGSVFQPSKNSFGQDRLTDRACSQSFSRASALRNHSKDGSLIRRYFLGSIPSRGVVRSSLCSNTIQLCAFSSEADGRNASGNNRKPVDDGANFDKGEKGKTRREKVKEDAKNKDAHARLGEHEQKEWLNNEKAAIESKKRESPFLTRRERFKNEFSRRIVPWEKINISWDTFPYYIK